jgi:hypothetical protein
MEKILQFTMKVEIKKHFLFTAGFIGTTFMAMAYRRHLAIKQYQEEQVFSLRNFTREFSKGTITFKPSYLPTIIFNIKEIIRVKLESATSSQKLTWSLIGINTLIFAAWRVPGLGPTMKR